MGLIEYEVDGTMIQQNIQIYTEEKDLSTLNYSYVITLKILPERKVTFYIAEDRNAKSISQFLFQVLKKDGIFKHTIKVYPGDYVLTSFKILALTKSAQGNELVLAKNMDIAAGH